MATFPNCPDLPEIRGGIGKNHLPGHKDPCHWEYSFYYIPGSGMFDGEGSERRWSIENEIAQSAQQMGPGQRHDALVYHNSDYNIQKTFGMGTSQLGYGDQLRPNTLIAALLSRRLARAAESEKTVSSALEQMNKTMNIKKRPILEWKSTEEAFLRDLVSPTPMKEKKLVSPYAPAKDNGTLFL